MRTVTAPGRWIWGVSGLVTAAALAVPGARLIASAGESWPVNAYAQPQATTTRTATVPPPVTSVTVNSYGAPVQVKAGPVRGVQVTETIVYDQQEGAPPAVSQSVAGGRLTLADPACGQPAAAGASSTGPLGAVPSPSTGPVGASASGCAVGFALTVPPDVAVSVVTEGGPVNLSGVAGASLDADTGGGPLMARGVGVATATVTTGGGDARISFATAPGKVTVSTDGGPVMLMVPGGPYALTADSGGGPELVGIATDPGARRSITVSSGGGPLQVGP